MIQKNTTTYMYILYIYMPRYAWGWNAKLQCGVPTPDGEGDNVSRPTLVGGLLGLGVHGAACGAAHSVAVTRPPLTLPTLTLATNLTRLPHPSPFQPSP